MSLLGGILIAFALAIQIVICYRLGFAYGYERGKKESRIK